MIVSLACVVSVLIYMVWARHSDTSFSNKANGDKNGSSKKANV